MSDFSCSCSYSIFSINSEKLFLSYFSFGVHSKFNFVGHWFFGNIQFQKNVDNLQNLNLIFESYCSLDLMGSLNQIVKLTFKVRDEGIWCVCVFGLHPCK